MKNFIHNNQTNKFNDAKPAGAAKIAPRQGQYYIQSIEFREVGVTGIVPIALVNWKQDNETYFLEGTLHEIALSGLYRNSTGEKSNNDFNDLIGKFISIDNPKIDYVVANNRTNRVLNYKWSVIESVPFKTATQLVAESFFGSATNGSEAYQTMLLMHHMTSLLRRNLKQLVKN
jgi:hypothetical protein